MLKGCNKVSWEPSLLQAEQSQSSQPFLTGEVFHPSAPSHGPPLKLLQEVQVFSTLRMTGKLSLRQPVLMQMVSTIPGTLRSLICGALHPWWHGRTGYTGLIQTRTHHQEYKIHTAEITHMNTKECICSIGNFSTGQRVLKLDQISTFSSFLILLVISYVHLPHLT